MAKITKQDVWRVAGEIDAGGDKPTVLEVRKRLGAGSFTTITASLREWVKPDASEEEDIDPMPEAVSDKVEQFGADLYALVYRLVQERFDVERAEFAAKIKEIEAERDEAASLSEIAESAMEALQVKVVETSDALVKCMSDLKVAELRLADATLDKERALLDAATARHEAGVLQGRLDALEPKDKPAKPSGPQKAKKPAQVASAAPVPTPESVVQQFKA